MSKKVQKPFKFDHRSSNPGLHLFYTKQAVVHLRELQRIAKTLCDFSNWNMHGPIMALGKAYETLCIENAAYADAHEILRSLKLTKYIQLAGDKLGDES